MRYSQNLYGKYSQSPKRHPKYPKFTQNTQKSQNKSRKHLTRIGFLPYI